MTEKNANTIVIKCVNCGSYEDLDKKLYDKALLARTDAQIREKFECDYCKTHKIIKNYKNI